MADPVKPRMPAKPPYPPRPRIPAKPLKVKYHARTPYGKKLTAASPTVGKAVGAKPAIGASGHHMKHIGPAVKPAKPSIGAKTAKKAKPAYFVPEIKSLKTLIKEITHEG